MESFLYMTNPTKPGTHWIADRCVLVLGSLLMLPVFALSAQDSTTVVTNEPAPETELVETKKPPPRPGRSFEDFQVIVERNIFDPNRSPRSQERPPEPELPPEPKIDIVALTGTLSYAKGTVAFFDSNSTDFRKTAKVGDQIAGYTLKAIEQSKVALEHESQIVALRVGQQLRRTDEGAWHVTTGEPLTRGGAPGSSSRRSGSIRRSFSGDGATTGINPAAPEEMDDTNVPDNDDHTEALDPDSDESGEGPSEILKRLMEQRRKEQAQ